MRWVHEARPRYNGMQEDATHDQRTSFTRDKQFSADHNRLLRCIGGLGPGGVRRFVAGAVACLVVLLLVSVLPVFGQTIPESRLPADSSNVDTDSAWGLPEPDSSDVEEDAEVFGLEPVLGGLRTGAGITAGARVIPYETNRFSLALEGRASIRKYWGVAALAGYDAGAFVAHAFTRYRHMPQEDFYTYEDGDETRWDYRLNDLTAGALLGYQPFERALAGVHLSYLSNDLGRGLTDDPDAVDALAGVPELAGDTRYAIAGLWFETDLRNVRYKKAYGSRFAPTRNRLRTMGLAVSRGVYASAELRRYQDLDDGRYSFNEAELEAQQFLTFAQRNVLGFRQYLLMTFTGTDEYVPFYLMPTLGGSRSLRGYDSFRFRDRNVLLFNGEYRWTKHRFIQPVLFVDAGYAFGDENDLNLADALIDYGAGLRFVFRNRVRLRAELAHSEEGFKPILRVGSYL